MMKNLLLVFGAIFALLGSAHAGPTMSAAVRGLEIHSVAATKATTTLKSVPKAVAAAESAATAALKALGLDSKLYAQGISGQGVNNPPVTQEPFPFTYNLIRGSARWRDGVGRIRDALPGGSTTQYGVDSVVLGDSTSTFGTIYESWPNFLRNRLQERFNPPGVEGGYGFFPISTQGATADGTTDWKIVNGTQTWGTTHNDINVAATGAVSVRIETTPAADNILWRKWDGADANASLHRQKITDVQYVGLGYTGFWDTINFDADTTVAPHAGSATITTADTNGTGYGEHWTRVTGITPTSTNYVQIRTRAAATSRVRASGIIAYNGDYNQGLRLHNLSSVGATTGSYAQMVDAGTTDLQLKANIDQWSTGANGGSRNAKLFLINLMINDYNAGSVQVAVAQFKINLQTIITRAVARPSRPCVGLIVNHPVYATNTPAKVAAYMAYKTACYQLADENKDTVFVVDQWKMLADDANTYEFVVSGGTTAPTAGATYTNNGVTYTVVSTGNASGSGYSGGAGIVAATGSGAPLTSGTLTKTGGTGDSTLTFSAVNAPQVQYALHGPNSAGGAMYNRGWSNDGTHGSSQWAQAMAARMFAVLTYGCGTDPVWTGVIFLVAAGQVRRRYRKARNNYAYSA